MSETKFTHPTQDPEWWLSRAKDERAFAAAARKTRGVSVESVFIHERNATEYEAQAVALARARGEGKS